MDSRDSSGLSTTKLGLIDWLAIVLLGLGVGLGLRAIFVVLRGWVA
jgi:hypothetical protein